MKEVYDNLIDLNSFILCYYQNIIFSYGLNNFYRRKQYI
jgi:hypothetical protein